MRSDYKAADKTEGRNKKLQVRDVTHLVAEEEEGKLTLYLVNTLV